MLPAIREWRRTPRKTLAWIQIFLLLSPQGTYVFAETYFSIFRHLSPSMASQDRTLYNKVCRKFNPRTPFNIAQIRTLVFVFFFWLSWVLITACGIFTGSYGIFCSEPWTLWASLVAQMVKKLPVMQETQVRSLGQEDPLEKGMATHFSILAWRIPWREEPGGLQSMDLQSGTTLSKQLTLSNGL